MHSLESAYGNWLLKFFACWFVQGSKPMARCFKVVIGQALAGIEQTNCHICSGVAAHARRAAQPGDRSFPDRAFYRERLLRNPRDLAKPTDLCNSCILQSCWCCIESSFHHREWPRRMALAT